ncbi:hypothetical protein BC628DRAFT_859035 [Trametes gibbosa]|nr:hypothetical protein BC628DRAFT_859035 [Trametes gibbosa]
MRSIPGSDITHTHPSFSPSSPLVFPRRYIALLCYHPHGRPNTMGGSLASPCPPLGSRVRLVHPLFEILRWLPVPQDTLCWLALTISDRSAQYASLARSVGHTPLYKARGRLLHKLSSQQCVTLSMCMLPDPLDSGGELSDVGQFSATGHNLTSSGSYRPVTQCGFPWSRGGEETADSHIILIRLVSIPNTRNLHPWHITALCVSA